MLRTVTHYCYSADRTLARHHVPRLRGLDTPAGHTQLAHQVLPFALKPGPTCTTPSGAWSASNTTTT